MPVIFFDQIFANLFHNKARQREAVTVLLSCFVMEDVRKRSKRWQATGRGSRCIKMYATCSRTVSRTFSLRKMLSCPLVKTCERAGQVGAFREFRGLWSQIPKGIGQRARFRGQNRDRKEWDASPSRYSDYGPCTNGYRSLYESTGRSSVWYVT